MAEIIEIEGGLVSLVTRQVSRQIPLEDFIPLVSKPAPVTLPTIGRTQVFGHYQPGSPNAFYILSEIPAGVKNISKNLRDGGARRYRLGMPWTYIWFVAHEVSPDSWTLDDMRIFFSRERYDGIETPFITAMLPNVYSGGEICWGSTGTSPLQSLADRIDILTNEWYHSRFNSDVDSSNSLPYGEPNYRRWVQETRDNPESWRNWPEWNSRTKWTVKLLLEQRDILVRPTIITLDNTIPEIPISPTFGMWDEWWTTNVPPEERARALISLQNLREDNPSLVPDLFAEPSEEEPVDDYDYDDDGGVPINE